MNFDIKKFSFGVTLLISIIFSGCAESGKKADDNSEDSDVVYKSEIVTDTSVGVNSISERAESARKENDPDNQLKDSSEAQQKKITKEYDKLMKECKELTNKIQNEGIEGNEIEQCRSLYKRYEKLKPQLSPEQRKNFESSHQKLVGHIAA